MKNKWNSFREQPVVHMILRWIVAILLLCSLLLNFFTYICPVVRHYGNSMSPLLAENQLLLLYRTDNVHRGDVVAFYYNNNIMVRRVIGTEGDNVDLDIFGTVTVNGEELVEDYVQVPSIGQTDLIYPYHVPARHSFMMGDQREISMDSRLTEIGPIPNERILGKVIFSLWPFHGI